MGKKKAFINRKTAVTYSLVYRDAAEETEGDDGGQRTLTPAGGHRGAQPAPDDHHDYYDDEVSLYESEYSLAMSRSAAAHHDSSYAMTEERRRELLSLGFPDDGYDYLRHMRDLGRGRPGPAPGAVAPIPEDQELEGFEEGDEGEGEDEEESEEDVTVYDGPEEPAGGRKKLDKDALAAVAAAAEAAAAAGPGTSAGGRAGGRSATAAAGPGPGSARTAAVAASVRDAAAAARARSVASTARTQGSAVGPSVYVRAAKMVAPTADVKVVDARRLVVRAKGHDEAAAAAALAEVTALSRPTELRGTRGKLYQDLDEVEQCMAEMENGNDPNRGEVVEGDEWADWLDEFVAGGGDDGDDDGAAAGLRAKEVEADVEEDEDEQEGGGASEEPEEEEEDADEWRMRHVRSKQQQQQQREPGAEEETGAGAGTAAAAAGPSTVPGGGEGPGAASVASSFWRPERRDRKEGFGALDSQFERLAVQYDDDEIGALEEERYGEDDGGDDEEEGGRDGEGAGRPQAAKGQAAAGTCELSDFADVLDEFLTEHRAAVELEAEGLRPLEATDDVATLVSRPDPEAIAATRARLQREAEAREAAGGADVAMPEPKSIVVMQDAERWDCESVLSLTSNLENHPGKIVEPQRRTGGRGGGLIRLSAKTGMPVAPRGVGAAPIPEEGELREQEGDAAEAASDDGDSEEGAEGAEGSVLDPALMERRKGETAEERKMRKAAVKEARRAHRSAKKEMKNMFRQQASKAQKQSAGRSQATGSTYIIP